MMIDKSTDMVSNKYNTPKHVLIVRLSAMGDVAMTVPVVDSLRKTYPDIRITILTRSFFVPFFRDIEGLAFLDFDPKIKHRGFSGLWLLSNEILTLGVDTVIDLHDVLRTKIIRTLLFTRKIAIYKIDKGRREKRLLVRRRNKRLEQLKTSVERYRDAVEKAGFKLDLPEPYKKNPRPMPPKLLSAEFEKKEGLWVGVAPFAQHRGKIYPIDKMERLIRTFNEKYDKVFIFGGGAEERSFAEVMEHDYGNVVSVIGRVSLCDELDVMSNLDLMVTMDSSSMHMASLVGVPVVSVWGATHPFAGFYGFGQNPKNAVQLDFQCRPCSIYGNKECIFNDYRCLNRISPSMIEEKVEKVLSAIK